MIKNKRNQHGAPTTSVQGGFPVTYHYTVGISAEKFFLTLKDKKFLANFCGSCNKTYLPPKIFCEECFDELGDDTYKEVGNSAELVSFTEVFHNFRGDKLENPYFLGLFKVEGTNTTFFHKLVDTDNPSIGMKVQPVWNDERKASIFDLKGFKA